MEIPYQGRATINEYFDGMEIIIPVKRNWFAFVVLPVGLAVWSVGFFFALTMLFSAHNGPADVFIFFWLCVWSLGGMFAAATLWWNIAGKEIVTLSQGVLTIIKKGAIAKTKSYELREATNFRAEEDFSDELSAFYGRRGPRAPWKVATEGTICFDYGMQTIGFGDRLHKAEGDYILERLRAKRLIK